MSSWLDTYLGCLRTSDGIIRIPRTLMNDMSAIFGGTLPHPDWSLEVFREEVENMGRAALWPTETPNGHCLKR
jgi:hypothetical protein